MQQNFVGFFSQWFFNGRRIDPHHREEKRFSAASVTAVAAPVASPARNGDRVGAGKKGIIRIRANPI